MARKKENKHTDGIPVAKDRPNFYLKYRPLRGGVSVPPMPMYRYETSRFGYFAYKYFLPAMMFVVYALLLFYHLYFITNWKFTLVAVASPFQIASAVVFFPSLYYLTRNLAHIIICEEGMFVRFHTGKVFVPWKYLRSYHQAAYGRPWVIVLSYYTGKRRYKRVYAIASLETEHTTTEMLNYIRKVRRQEGPEPVQI